MPDAVAVDLRVLGDVEPLWRAWLEDAARRTREPLEPGRLDEQLPGWRPLLERFAADNGPVHLRPSAPVTAELRRLRNRGARIGVFSDVPVELAQLAVAHLGAARRVDVVGTLDDVRRELGEPAVARTLDELREV